jgi:2-polyprenyl-6-methoxyphenol hydroxylase-like FAD-dependent oxidoreductase
LLKIAIIGYGIAGIAAAILVRRQGHQITHFETRPRATRHGAGIVIAPRGLRALNIIGVMEHALSLGARIAGIRAESVTQGCFMDIAYREAGADCDALGLQRAALAELLAAADVGRDSVRFEQGVERIDPHTATLTTATKNTEQFDLVIVADGANSTHRDSTMGHLIARNKLYPTSALVALVPDDCETAQPRVSQRFDGARHVSIWPVGHNNADSKNQTAVAINVFSEAEFLANPMHWWKSAVTAIRPKLEKSLEQMGSRYPIHFRYRDVKMKRYFYERVVLIGDAAHAMSPQLGLGATLALTDAVALAACLRAERNVAVALEEFDRCQRSAHMPIQSASRFLTPIMQSNSAVLVSIRNRALKAAHSSRALQRQIFAQMI